MLKQSYARFLIAALAAAVVAPAVAQDKFPSGPIQVIIHSAYGGGTDVTAQMMMIRSRRELDTDMQVVPKRGGSGAAAHKYAMERPRDGHTLLALTQTHLYTIARGQSPLKIDDLVGIARAMDDPTFIVVSGKSAYKSLGDLVKASKEKVLNWGVAQIGGTEHIGLATFAKAAGFKFKVVPFGSGAQMVQALMSGAIDATVPNVSESITQVQDGTFRALAVMAEKRLKDFPDVPTTFESGYRVKTSTTRGYAVLKGTPQPVIDKLSKALVKAMSHEVFANYLKTAGLTVEDSVAGHEVWDKHIKEEYQVAAQALKELGLLKKQP
ncbi:MAG TPA: tripartite tricarboxylate transporter substrate binding protein [Burkholderiales bacterium]|nr:tripartite tricarboxylate transporter substrate binding protein [Burkholderiales bacterium]